MCKGHSQAKTLHSWDRFQTQKRLTPSETLVEKPPGWERQAAHTLCLSELHPGEESAAAVTHGTSCAIPTHLCRDHRSGVGSKHLINQLRSQGRSRHS